MINAVQMKFVLNAQEGFEADWRVLATRHVGWIFSLLIAAICRSKLPDSKPWFLLAAYSIAFDALATDLFCFKPLFSDSNYLNTGTLVFHCGNFGLIVLNPLWFKDGGKSVLDVIEKMVEITMIRGAQSGGVVTFDEKKSGENESREMIGTRTRVVKSKRSDLSILLRKNLSASVGRTRNPVALQKSSEYVPKFYAGHTRFATSSVADFSGTHPHQWSKPSSQRVYDFSESVLRSSDQRVEASSEDLSGRRLRSKASRELTRPKVIRVENFISHNGDFEFFDLNDTSYDADTVMNWLEIALECQKPAYVDSAGIAGMVDLIRCQGCFALSIRFTVCLGLPMSKISDSKSAKLPVMKDYKNLGTLFEEALAEYQSQYPINIEDIRSSLSHRVALCDLTVKKLLVSQSGLEAFSKYMKHPNSDIPDVGITKFVRVVIDAFFDNDLLQTVKYFMFHAKGSFGLCVMSSLESHRQLCLASRGQTISVAFYPKTGAICYGSEQAAVKAGTCVDLDELDMEDPFVNDKDDMEVQRLDLDDLNGEICLIDWANDGNPIVSPPNRQIQQHSVMGGKVKVILTTEKMNEEKLANTTNAALRTRMTMLTNNPFVAPLPPTSNDPIRQDLIEIPLVCKKIQDDWNNKHDKMFSLNRLTALNLGRCIKERIEACANGKYQDNPNRVDILCTGCEVSLWLAEQFASDLQKAFPNLRILALSSNKLLGLYGQDTFGVPTVGFPQGTRTMDLDDTITIICSHSGGTFSPLACSSLFQSSTRNIFVVASEWDTQIGKQLRAMNKSDENVDLKFLFDSRIFTTDVGIRTAEPCSLSIVAMHVLLTKIFQHISIVILSTDSLRQFSGAVITQQDLEILERCNTSNIRALMDIVGADEKGVPLKDDVPCKERELRAAGDIWSEHILENVRAYVMSFIYIVATVVSGYPIVSGIALGAGLSSESRIIYLLKLFDALIYFWLPQINVIILRLIQRRPLLHRMVGRTVVIGDIPWVAQAAEAFLSKIFACSYSIAGLNVHSANPSDHLVHRMTHRVVRGTLCLVGRPDGRLNALTAMESSVCLSVNQASSIQSLGSRCESVTIGHNPFKLPLSARAIFLDRYRPLFLCEHLLDQKLDVSRSLEVSCRGLNLSRRNPNLSGALSNETLLDETIRHSSHIFKKSKGLSSAALLGKYKGLERDTHNLLEHHFLDKSHKVSMTMVIETALHRKKWSNNVRRLFEVLDVDQKHYLKKEEFLNLSSYVSSRSRDELNIIFDQFTGDQSGHLTYDEFYDLMSKTKLELEAMLEPRIRDERGVIQIKTSKERFFGETIVKAENLGTQDSSKFAQLLEATTRQGYAQELYESRVASLQRFVSMTVMFHQMGWRVERFFSKNTFGLLGYRIDRTHSIMRVATTASPISGADVRDSAKLWCYMKRIKTSVKTISQAWIDYNTRKKSRVKKALVSHE